MCTSSDLVAFRINDRQFALPLAVVERIVQVVGMTPLPNAPDMVLGVINVQGEIMPVIGVHERFGMPVRDIALSDCLILTRTTNLSVALLVDTVTGVIAPLKEGVDKIETLLPRCLYRKSGTRTTSCPRRRVSSPHGVRLPGFPLSRA